jgi:hypothetical protein
MEYRSSLRILGLPLVHIATGSAWNGTYRRGVATGWVAAGDIAIGILFAFGGVAVGGISIGGVSVGLLSIGGLSVGLAALGGLAAGMVAVGGAAFAWHMAMGGLAVAHDYAAGGLAVAQRVFAPVKPELWLHYPHPQAPFRVEDAFWLLAIILALLLVARHVQQSRAESP